MLSGAFKKVKNLFNHGDDYQKAIKLIQCLILECFRTSNFNVFNHDDVQKVVTSSQYRAFSESQISKFSSTKVE